MGDEELIILAIAGLVTIILPPLSGFLAGRFTDKVNALGSVLIGAAPAVIVIGGFALWTALTADMRQVPQCEPPDCSMAPMLVILMLIFAAILGAVGAAFGFVSFRIGRRIRDSKQGWDL